ncbi:MAG TPA: dTDP-4-dehydrorhamnose reductase [Thermodesulforhabdus norvegica]|uniref:dTDP-4-dehydrorhamnose reductase n=1 Tax=Thermodesulforhabdus norvegica TaxID=39841 RepID=A0A7C0WV50_9BACT|nr:dTDP-4-dehydrorhamnose reductase [Thermodesulforhabdus norvegica]
MKVIVTGGGGQLSTELSRVAPAEDDVAVLSSGELDITDGDSIRQVLDLEKPHIVINCAAYTAVDRAEDEQDMAYLVNRDGVALLARECARRNIGLIHISTDFIFDGKAGRPYRPDDIPAPLSVYGASKLEGEQELMSLYPNESIIVRTAWLYSAYGRNFVKTMLELFETKDVVKVVEDQVGTPTWAHNLANFLWFLTANFKNCKGRILHFTDTGVASWYDFAVAIEEESRKWRSKKEVQVLPVSSEEYPTKARRPFYSVLDKTETWRVWGRTSEHWRVSLRKMLRDYYST